MLGEKGLEPVFIKLRCKITLLKSRKTLKYCRLKYKTRDYSRSTNRLKGTKSVKFVGD